jgi:hypothetical protein
LGGLLVNTVLWSRKEVFAIVIAEPIILATDAGEVPAAPTFIGPVLVTLQFCCACAFVAKSETPKAIPAATAIPRLLRTAALVDILDFKLRSLQVALKEPLNI